MIPNAESSAPRQSGRAHKAESEETIGDPALERFDPSIGADPKSLWPLSAHRFLGAFLLLEKPCTKPLLLKRCSRAALSARSDGDACYIRESRIAAKKAH
jgi:hypothetical protein